MKITVLIAGALFGLAMAYVLDTTGAIPIGQGTAATCMVAGLGLALALFWIVGRFTGQPAAKKEEKSS